MAKSSSYKSTMKAFGVYYNYKKAAIIGILIGILLAAIMGGAEALFYFKMEDKVNATAKFDDIVYNEESNTSSFKMDVKLENAKRGVGTVATSATYKLIFKTKGGETLGEQEVTVNEAFETREESYTYGEGGDFGAITGKLGAVDIEVTNATYMNAAAHSGAESTLQFLISHWYFPLLVLAMILLMMVVFLIMESDPPLIVNVIEWILMIVAVVAGAIGIVPVVYSFFI